MSTSPQSPALSLLRDANKATQSLSESIEEQQLTASVQPWPTPDDDVAVLREKYWAANRYVQSLDRTARWIGDQTRLAVEIQAQQDAQEFIGRLKYVLEKAMEPVPSWDLIQADLDVAASHLGESYAGARRAWRRVVKQAWQDVEALLLDIDHGRLITALALFLAATAESIGVRLMLVRHLRNLYELGLQAHKSRPPIDPERFQLQCSV